MNTLFKAGLVLLIPAFVAGHCPEGTSCKCSETGGDISVQCEGPENANYVQSVLENFKNPRSLELILESLTVQLGSTFFRQVSSLRLYDVRIEQARSNFSFEFPKLSEVILQSSVISGKKLPDFKSARRLRHLEISEIEVPQIGSSFREDIPDTLTYLDVRKTRTSAVESGALSHLKRLQYFIMVDLPIYEFSRNILPVIMPELHTFILGNTEIEKLGENFFDGMPKLEVIMLNGNKLTTLDFKWFVAIDNQISHLLAERNPLVCNCDLLWLKHNVQNRESMKVLASCRDAMTFKRKEITKLNENEYC